ncbi:hypothetical protein BK786_28885 [Bacillus thuringiensis serovar thailandensis]|nr:hypothetical protein BK786_28885 [Bacillus thuringiensis serovar thailandensis]
MLVFSLLIISLIGFYLISFIFIDKDIWWNKPIDSLRESYFILRKKYFTETYIALFALILAFLSLIVASITTFITYLFSKRVFDISKIATDTANKAHELAIQDHKIQFNKEFLSNYSDDRECVQLASNYIKLTKEKLSDVLIDLEETIKDKSNYSTISDESVDYAKVLVKIQTFRDSKPELQNTFRNLSKQSHFIAANFYEFIRRLEVLLEMVKQEDTYSLLKFDNFDVNEFMRTYETFLECVNSDDDCTARIPHLYIEEYYRPRLSNYRKHLEEIEDLYYEVEQLLEQYDKALIMRYRNTVKDVIHLLNDYEKLQ